MTTAIEEGHLRFEFGNSRSVERYDGQEGVGKREAHSFYRNRVSKLPETKAVDFVGLSNPHGASYLIEVKDFRGYRIQNEKRLTTDELAREVAFKVRDSVAGVVGAKRSYQEGVLPEAADNLVIPEKDVGVVLWLEDDAAKKADSWKAELATLVDKIKAYLSWLTSKILVVSLSTHHYLPPDLKVTNLPGAGQPNP
ncbi:MAG: hypothetical protein AB1898_30225 [Acidobacteriota bacterium]